MCYYKIKLFEPLSHRPSYTKSDILRPRHALMRPERSVSYMRCHKHEHVWGRASSLSEQNDKAVMSLYVRSAGKYALHDNGTIADCAVTCVFIGHRCYTCVSIGRRFFWIK